MTKFQGDVFTYLHWKGELFGIYGCENYSTSPAHEPHYIGAWDANREVCLAILCAEDWNAENGQRWIERATKLAANLSSIKTWDEYWGDYQQYQHLPVLVVPAGADYEPWMPDIEAWDGVLWEFDGIGMIGVDR